MKTRFHILAILFTVGLLCLFGIVPCFLLDSILPPTEKPDGETLLIFSLLSFLFLGVIGAVIRLSLRIEVDPFARTFTFHYPFRFQTFTYSFRDLIGFRFGHLPTKIAFKVLKFRTADGRTFAVSDFETRNLRELERFCLENVALRAGKNFEPLSASQRMAELEQNMAFDHQQTRDIRLQVGRLFVMLATTLLLSLFHWRNDNFPLSIGFLSVLTLTLLLLVRTGIWFLQVHRKVKEESLASKPVGDTQAKISGGL